MVQTTIRLPKELHRKLKKKAKKRGMSFNGYVVNCLFAKEEKEV